MHQSTMRIVGLAAALLAATAVSVPVDCGAIDALWEDQAAVVGNFPECESYYDHTNTEQTAELPADHPHLDALVLCRRDGRDTDGYHCPGGAKRAVNLEVDTLDALVKCRRQLGPDGFKCGGTGKRNNQPAPVTNCGDARRTIGDLDGFKCGGTRKRNNQPAPVTNCGGARRTLGAHGFGCPGNRRSDEPVLHEERSSDLDGGWKYPASDGQRHKRAEGKVPPGIGHKPPIFQVATASDDEKRALPVVGNKPPGLQNPPADKKREEDALIGHKPAVYDKRNANQGPGNWAPGVGP